MKSKTIFTYALLSAVCLTAPTIAHAKTGDPVAIGSGFTLDPILDVRARYEHVEQDKINLDADAMTVRMRSGLELASDSGFSALVEAEATLGIVNDYNSTVNGKAGLFSIVADPENIELNRAQIQYVAKDKGRITVGRQRINIDDQRFVGSVGWRQNEQTFDAVSVSLNPFKPVTLEATYANSQRTIFGIDAGARQSFDGDFVFLGAGTKLGPVNLKAFTYLIDYDLNEPAIATYPSTQTYGVRATAALPLGNDFKLDLAGSYAVQKDWKTNPRNYSVDYIAASIGTSVAGFGLTGGYEKLGADGAGNRFQTPLATLHKFNGWADVFLLSTPVNGLQDYYVTLGKKLAGVKMLPGLNASVTYHKFESDVGDVDFGDEWDTQIGFKIKSFAVTLKYANYHAEAFSTDIERYWFDIGYAF